VLRAYLEGIEDEVVKIKEENGLLKGQVAEKSERIKKMERELRRAVVTFHRVEDIVRENESLVEQNKRLNNEVETLSVLYAEAKAEVDEWAQRLSQE